MEAGSRKHWTARKVPCSLFLTYFYCGQRMHLCLFIMFLLFKNFKFCIGVYLTNSVVLAAGVQWSDCYTYYASVLLKILFPFGGQSIGASA